MKAVVGEIARYKGAAEDRLAGQISALLGYHPQPYEASEFVAWCKQNGLSHYPARPATVAAYVLDLSRCGLPVSSIVERLESVARSHDATHGNPVATEIVGLALEKIRKPADIQPPRSWRKDEMINFYLLPTWTQAVIARRESEREADLRRRHNEFAEQRRKLETTNEAQHRPEGKEDGTAAVAA